MDGDEAARIREWLSGQVPAEWFVEPIELHVDREEVLVVGRLASPPDGSAAADTAERVGRFRGESREIRTRIGDSAERRFGRRVSWGVRIDDAVELFTTLAVPVTTRLRMPERAVVDTLVTSGVVRSRADALAWCVRSVAQDREEWLGELREAAAAVRRMRREEPARR